MVCGRMVVGWAVTLVSSSTLEIQGVPRLPTFGLAFGQLLVYVTFNATHISLGPAIQKLERKVEW